VSAKDDWGNSPRADKPSGKDVRALQSAGLWTEIMDSSECQQELSEPVRPSPAISPICICKTDFCAKVRDENSAATRAAFQRCGASPAASGQAVGSRSTEEQGGDAKEQGGGGRGGARRSSQVPGSAPSTRGPLRQAAPSVSPRRGRARRRRASAHGGLERRPPPPPSCCCRLPLEDKEGRGATVGLRCWSTTAAA
jgi:hypothetical protein